MANRVCTIEAVQYMDTNVNGWINERYTSISNRVDYGFDGGGGGSTTSDINTKPATQKPTQTPITQYPRPVYTMTPKPPITPTVPITLRPTYILTSPPPITPTIIRTLPPTTTPTAIVTYKPITPVVDIPERVITYAYSYKYSVPSGWNLLKPTVNPIDNSISKYDPSLNKVINLSEVDKTITYWTDAINKKYENSTSGLEFYTQKESNKLFDYYTYSIDNSYISKFYDDLYESFTNVRKFNEDSKNIIKSFSEYVSDNNSSAIVFEGLKENEVNIIPVETVKTGKNKFVHTVYSTENYNIYLNHLNVQNDDIFFKTSNNVVLDFDGTMHFVNNDIGYITAYSSVDHNVYKSISVKPTRVEYIPGELEPRNTFIDSIEVTCITTRPKYVLYSSSSIASRYIPSSMNIHNKSIMFDLTYIFSSYTYTYTEKDVVKTEERKYSFDDGKKYKPVMYCLNNGASNDVKNYENESTLTKCRSDLQTPILDKYELKRFANITQFNVIDATHVEINFEVSELVNLINTNKYLVSIHDENDVSICKFIIGSFRLTQRFPTGLLQPKFKIINALKINTSGGNDNWEHFGFNKKICLTSNKHYRFETTQSNHIISSINIQSASSSTSNIIPKIKLDNTGQSGTLIALGKGSFVINYSCYNVNDGTIDNYTDSFSIKPAKEGLVKGNDGEFVKDEIKIYKSAGENKLKITLANSDYLAPLSIICQFNGYAGSNISENLIKNIKTNYRYNINEGDPWAEITFDTDSKINSDNIPFRIYYITYDNNLKYIDYIKTKPVSTLSMRKARRMGDQFIDYLGNEYAKNLDQPLYNVSKENRISPFIKISLGLSDTPYMSQKIVSVRNTIKPRIYNLKTDIARLTNGAALNSRQLKKVQQIENTYSLPQAYVTEYLKSQGFIQQNITVPSSLSYVSTLKNSVAGTITGAKFDTPIFAFDNINEDKDNVSLWNVIPTITFTNKTIKHTIEEHFGKVKSGCQYNSNEKNYDLQMEKNSDFDSEFEDTHIEIKISETDKIYVTFYFKSSNVIRNGKLESYYMIDESTISITGILDGKQIKTKYISNGLRDDKTGLLTNISLKNNAVSLVVSSIGSKKRISLTFVISEYNVVNDDLIIDHLQHELNEKPELTLNYTSVDNILAVKQIENKNSYIISVSNKDNSNEIKTINDTWLSIGSNIPSNIKYSLAQTSPLKQLQSNSHILGTYQNNNFVVKYILPTTKPSIGLVQPIAWPSELTTRVLSDTNYENMFDDNKAVELPISKDYKYNICFDAVKIFSRMKTITSGSIVEDENDGEFYLKYSLEIDKNTTVDKTVKISDIFVNVHILCKNKLIIIKKKINIADSFEFCYNDFFKDYGHITGLLITDTNNNPLYSFKLDTSFEPLTQANTILKRIYDTPIFFFDDASSEIKDNGDYDNLLPDYTFYRSSLTGSTEEGKLGFLSRLKFDDLTDDDKFLNFGIIDNKYPALFRKFKPSIKENLLVDKIEFDALFKQNPELKLTDNTVISNILNKTDDGELLDVTKDKITSMVNDYNFTLNTENNKVELQFSSVAELNVPISAYTYISNKKIDLHINAKKYYPIKFVPEYIHHLKLDETYFPTSIDLIGYVMYYVNMAYLKALNWNKITDSEDLIYYIILLDKLNNGSNSFSDFKGILKDAELLANRIPYFDGNRNYIQSFDYVDFFVKNYNDIVKIWNDRYEAYSIIESALDEYDENLDVANQLDAYLDKVDTNNNDKREKIYYILTGNNKATNKEITDESPQYSWAINQLNNRIFDPTSNNYIWRNVFNIIFGDLFDVSLINDAILRDIYNYGLYPIINVPEMNKDNIFVPYELTQYGYFRQQIAYKDKDGNDPEPFWVGVGEPIYQYKRNDLGQIIGIERTFKIAPRAKYWESSNSKDYIDVFGNVFSEYKITGKTFNFDGCEWGILKYKNDEYSININGKFKLQPNGLSEKKNIYYARIEHENFVTYRRLLNYKECKECKESDLKVLSKEDYKDYWLDEDSENLVKMNHRNIREAIRVQKLLCKLFVSELAKTTFMIDILDKYRKMLNVVNDLKNHWKKEAINKYTLPNSDNTISTIHGPNKIGENYNYTLAYDYTKLLDFNVTDFVFTYNCIYPGDKTLYGILTYSYQYYNGNTHAVSEYIGETNVSVDLPTTASKIQYNHEMTIHDDLLSLHIIVPQNNIKPKSNVTLDIGYVYSPDNQYNDMTYVIVKPQIEGIEKFGIYPWNINKEDMNPNDDDPTAYAMTASWSYASTDLSGLCNFRDYDKIKNYTEIDKSGFNNSNVITSKVFAEEIGDAPAVTLAYNYYPEEWFGSENKYSYVIYSYTGTYTYSYKNSGKTVKSNEKTSVYSISSRKLKELPRTHVTITYNEVNTYHSLVNGKETSSYYFGEIHYEYSRSYLISNIPTYSMKYTIKTYIGYRSYSYFNGITKRITSYIEPLTLVDNTTSPPGNDSVNEESGKPSTVAETHKVASTETPVYAYKLTSNIKNDFNINLKDAKPEIISIGTELNPKTLLRSYINSLDIAVDRTAVIVDDNDNNDPINDDSSDKPTLDQYGSYTIKTIVNNTNCYIYQFENNKIHYDCEIKDINRSIYDFIPFFLGSVSQWQLIQDNVREINDMLSTYCKYNGLEPDYFYDGRIDRNIDSAKSFWTSSEINSTDAWIMFFDKQMLKNTKKIGGAYVRPFIALGKYEKYIYDTSIPNPGKNPEQLTYIDGMTDIDYKIHYTNIILPTTPPTPKPTTKPTIIPTEKPDDTYSGDLPEMEVWITNKGFTKLQRMVKGSLGTKLNSSNYPRSTFSWFNIFDESKGHDAITIKFKMKGDGKVPDKYVSVFVKYTVYPCWYQSQAQDKKDGLLRFINPSGEKFYTTVATKGPYAGNNLSFTFNTNNPGWTDINKSRTKLRRCLEVKLMAFFHPDLQKWVCLDAKDKINDTNVLKNYSNKIYHSDSEIYQKTLQYELFFEQDNSRYDYDRY